MDDFTNYLLSGVLALVVWAVGAVYVKVTDPATERYIFWLKIWAITAPVQAVIFSILLELMFPAPAPNLTQITNLLG